MNKKESIGAVELCEGYLLAKKRLLKNQKDITAYRKKMETEVTEFERLLLEDCVEEKLKECQESQRIIYLFDAANGYLDEEEGLVIQQKYNEGKNWRDITWSDGRHMSTSTVGELRKRAMKKISAFLVRMAGAGTGPDHSTII